MHVLPPWLGIQDGQLHNLHVPVPNTDPEPVIAFVAATTGMISHNRRRLMLITGRSSILDIELFVGTTHECNRMLDDETSITTN